MIMIMIMSANVNRREKGRLGEEYGRWRRAKGGEKEREKKM